MQFTPKYVLIFLLGLTLMITGCSTFWAEGVPGPGIGETFEVTLLDLGGWAHIFPYNEMCIVNGYAKNETVWQENNRVKSMKPLKNIPLPFEVVGCLF